MNTTPQDTHRNRPARLTREATKKARASLSAELRRFAKDAHMTDIYFMREVMEFRECMDYPSAELTMPGAFDSAITGSGCAYLKVPTEYAKSVASYADALKAGEVTEVQQSSKDSPSSDEQVERVRLPRTVQVSDDERVWIVRFIRLLRDNYWVSELVRQILKKEAENTHQLTIKEIIALLNNFDTIEALASNARRMGANWSDHPILRAIRKEWNDIEDYKDERTIQRLIDSAAKK